MDDEDDIYETMNDDEYNKLVQKRREEDSFVVDDGMLILFRKNPITSHHITSHHITSHHIAEGYGYHDDGEEVLGVGEEQLDGKHNMIQQQSV